MTLSLFAQDYVWCVRSVNKLNHFKIEDNTDSINEAAVKLCEDVKASGMIALTASGASVRKIARYRPRKEIYAVVHSPKVARFLTICWGVVPAFLVKEGSLGQSMAQVMNKGLERNVLDTQSCYILTAGDPSGTSGTTNLIRIITQNEMEYFKSIQKI